MGMFDEILVPKSYLRGLLKKEDEKLFNKEHLFQTKDLEKIVRELNFQLHHNSHGQHFITFFIGMVDLKTGDMDYINAGHNPPFLLRQSEAGWRHGRLRARGN